MKTPAYTTIASGVTFVAYGINVRDSSGSKGKGKFDDPLAFDDYDLWLGADLDYFLDNLLDDLFDDIESDITSVWSTNASEQLSQ